MKIFLRMLLLALLTFPAFAQSVLPPVQPQPGLQALTTIEIRLKGVPTATNPSPTVRLIKWSPKTIDVETFAVSEMCWNAKSPCPKVVEATARVYLTLPWLPNVNVTRFVLCPASECLLPPFSALQAKPGEIHWFIYNRYTAQWKTPPSVVSGAP